ncbi:MAG: hypothetical protein ACOWWH_01875 [Eubacteriaceae bacterium]
MKNVLLVCTGNTCRSSMAEGILKYLIKDKQVHIKSAGTSVFMSEPANNKAIKVMEEMGFDISKHRSKPITEELIKESDIILTMTKAHKEKVINASPQAKEKVFTLKEYAFIDSEKKIIKEIENLENRVDLKKHKYLDENLDVIGGLIKKKKELNNEIKNINNDLIEHKRKIMEYIRKEVTEINHLESLSNDISDPFGKDLNEYRNTAKEIKEVLEEISKVL